MIEIPEAKTLAAQIETHMIGKTVVSCTVMQDVHKFAFINMEPEDFAKCLTNQTIRRAAAYGGHVTVYLDDVLLDFNDGVNMLLLNVGEKHPKKHQLLLTFDDASCFVCTVQMYGGMHVQKQSAPIENEYYLIAKNSPDVLSDDFSFAYFQSLYKGESFSVKEFLATKQRIPGLGNGVLQDILFSAHLHPKRKMTTLSPAEFDCLYQKICSVLFEMTFNGGRDVEKNLFGEWGKYQTFLSKKTWKEPCRVCGDTLVRQAYLGGNIYFCPTCQPFVS